MNFGKNLLSDLIDDKTYCFMMAKGLLDPVRVRNYFIKKQFYHYRKRQMPVKKILEILNRQAPELSQGHIRKIIYTHDKKQ